MISRIPSEIQQQILLNLPIKDIATTCNTCKKMAFFSSDTALWKQLCRRDLEYIHKIEEDWKKTYRISTRLPSTIYQIIHIQSQMKDSKEEESLRKKNRIPSDIDAFRELALNVLFPTEIKHMEYSSNPYINFYLEEYKEVTLLTGQIPVQGYAKFSNIFSHDLFFFLPPPSKKRKKNSLNQSDGLCLFKYDNKEWCVYGLQKTIRKYKVISLGSFISDGQFIDAELYKRLFTCIRASVQS